MTRYQGSKRKLLPELYGVFSSLSFKSSLDAFGGTGSVTHLLKNMGKKVHYNDILPSNYHIARALHANKNILLKKHDTENLFQQVEGQTYSDHISSNFYNVYFTEDENHQLDIVCQNICNIEDSLKKSEAYYCLFQAAISKRPYNLFHRANLNMRLKDVQRSFGNKKTWDRPFLSHMLKFRQELENYRFGISKYTPTVTCKNSFVIDNRFDLIYIDTPYAKSRAIQESNYFNFYHFLDAMVSYREIPSSIWNDLRHKPFYEPNKLWYKERNIGLAFEHLFARYKKSTLVVSYRSDGFPSIETLCSYLQKYYSYVKVLGLSEYKYVLSKNSKNTKEVVIIATN